MHVSIKEQALRLIGDLPDNTGWDEVLYVLTGAATAGGAWPAGAVREFRPTYGEPTATGTTGEARVSYDFDVIVERDAEGWYVGSVPALEGCHTQARSVDQLMGRIREAIELALEVAGGRPSDTGFVGVRRVSVTV